MIAYILRVAGALRRAVLRAVGRGEGAAAVFAAWERSKRRRAREMPTEQDALEVMFRGWYRLKELGWRDAIYCPKDGSSFLVVEPGSTGIHRAHYWGEWPTGTWFVEDGGDLYPSTPTLFKLIEGEPAPPRHPRDRIVRRKVLRRGKSGRKGLPPDQAGDGAA
jgi:hypothetical protein